MRGTLANILAQGDYELDFISLDVHLTRVRTGPRGGQWHCIIITKEEEM